MESLLQPQCHWVPVSLTLITACTSSEQSVLRLILSEGDCQAHTCHGMLAPSRLVDISFASIEHKGNPGHLKSLQGFQAHMPPK